LCYSVAQKIGNIQGAKVSVMPAFCCVIALRRR